MEIRQTKDGSFTLYLPNLDEHYHSFHGARTESEHVFIQNGLCFQQENVNALNVLEIGLGTSYNALLTRLHANKKVNYTGLELHPVKEEISTQLAHKDPFLKQHQDLYQQIVDASWNEMVALDAQFSIEKLQQDVFTWEGQMKHFDLIYYDAFGFRAQSEMWCQSLYEKMFTWAKPNACLVTYAAKGIIRRGLQDAGWTVTRLPGPPGKREMLRAIK